MAIIVPIRNDGGMTSGRHNGMPMESCERILEILGRINRTWFGLDLEGNREKDRKDDVFVFSLRPFVPFSEIGNKKYVGQKREDK